MSVNDEAEWPWSEPENQFVRDAWHGDTFDFPEGAVRLATSIGCQNQTLVHAYLCRGVPTFAAVSGPRDN